VTRVALLGFGTVGSAVARRLLAGECPLAHISLTHIFDRRAADKSAAFVGTAAVAPARGRVQPAWTACIDEVLRGDADIVVEALGGVEPAAEWIRAALAAGKSVVTANKQVVARDGPALWQAAARQGRQFRYEAAVGGAMPIVRAIADGLAGDRLTRIAAILNGTTNAVLSRMEATGCALAEALADARARGFAEADPAADLDGDDARAKLTILCALAFGVRVRPASIAARSVRHISASAFAEARRCGCTVRQLAVAEYDAGRRVLEACVGPMLVASDSIFGRAVGPRNAAVITGEHSGEVGIFGTGAGGDATAVAILSDIAAIARDRAAIVPPPALTSDVTVAIPEIFRRSSTDVFPLHTFETLEPA
jgi:homoserine dehydrogenase